jgi:hypothetical protein
MAAGIAIGTVLSDAEEQHMYNEALGLAIDTGKWFSNQLNLATLPLFHSAICNGTINLPLFATEDWTFRRRGVPADAPPKYSRWTLHTRNVTGVCDDPALMERFNGIAATIKKNANMEGVWSIFNLLRKQSCACSIHLSTQKTLKWYCPEQYRRSRP